jgi:hypothetical protein
MNQFTLLAATISSAQTPAGADESIGKSPLIHASALNHHVASAFWENWNLSIPTVKQIKSWNPPIPNPPDIIVIAVVALVSLLFACYLFRMITAAHWNEYRGVWVPAAVMISLFLIGFFEMAAMVNWIR